MAPSPIPALKQSVDLNLEIYQLQMKIAISVIAFVLLTL